MTRREFLVAVAGTLACTQRSRAAERAVPEIGYLLAGSRRPDSVSEAYWKGLGELGYVRDQNVRVEFRAAENDVSRLPELAKELVQRQVSVIYVPATGAALFAAKAATTTIPIVFVNSGDPIRMGYVASLSRPGGNITGVTDFGDELSAKRLELIKQLVPAASRIGILVPRNNKGLADEVAHAREIVSGLSLETVESSVGNLQEIEAALASFAQDRIDGIYFTPGPLLFGLREQIVALVARYRLPAIYSFFECAEVGGLVSYGGSVAERSYEAGRYTGLVLKGAKPAEMPVRRLTKFALAINLATARSLGITVPASFLALTDQVIE